MIISGQFIWICFYSALVQCVGSWFWRNLWREFHFFRFVTVTVVPRETIPIPCQVSATYLNGTEAEPPSNITISVQDINDNKPQFAAGHHYAYVKERSPIGELSPSPTCEISWPVAIGRTVIKENGVFWKLLPIFARGDGMVKIPEVQNRKRFSLRFQPSCEQSFNKTPGGLKRYRAQ